jgi:hypothetical protein
MSVLDDENTISHDCISNMVVNEDILVALGFEFKHTVVRTSTVFKSDYIPTDTEYYSFDFTAFVNGEERKVKVNKNPLDDSFIAELFVNGFAMNMFQFKFVYDLNIFCKIYLNTTLI